MKFKTVCDNLAAIQKPVSDEDKTVQLSHCLGKKHDVFITTMLSKPPFPTFCQFITALQNYDLRIEEHSSEEKKEANTNFAFAIQRNGDRGRGNNFNRGRNNNFGSKGRGFTTNHSPNTTSHGNQNSTNRSSQNQSDGQSGSMQGNRGNNF